ALGLMLYEMLSGKPAFDGQTMMALLVKHMTETPPPLPPTIPRQLSRLVFACLEKKPEDRPQSADEILERLSEFTGGVYIDPRRSALGITAHGPGSPRLPAAGPFAAWAERFAPLLRRLDPLLAQGQKWLTPLLHFLKQPISERGPHLPRWIP